MDRKVLIFSGAGLSASSGISTFRYKDGLWENHDIKEICSRGCLQWNYDATINFYNLRRQNIKEKLPNNAHKMIARLKDKYPNKIEVITQNIDDLLQRANCKDVLHLHGFLRELRCMRCDEIVDINYEIQDKSNSTCSSCGAKMRPNVVFFGEAAPMYERLYSILENCDLLVVIGTSGNVIDVIYEENFDKIYYEDANTAFGKIEDDIEGFIQSGEF